LITKWDLRSVMTWYSNLFFSCLKKRYFDSWLSYLMLVLNKQQYCLPIWYGCFCENMLNRITLAWFCMSLSALTSILIYLRWSSQSHVNFFCIFGSLFGKLKGFFFPANLNNQNNIMSSEKKLPIIKWDIKWPMEVSPISTRLFYLWHLSHFLWSLYQDLRKHYNN
jgi:hypothetical protein